MTVCVYPSRTNSLSVDLFAWWDAKVKSVDTWEMRLIRTSGERLIVRFPLGNLTMSLSSRIRIAHELDHRHNLSRVQVLALV